MRNAVSLAVLLLLLAGCLLIPIPEHGDEHSLREPIKESSLQFMNVGSTTREEVLLNLGDPDLFSVGFVYRWMTEYSFILILIGTGVGGGRADVYSVYELVIEFDDNGIVKHYETNRIYRWDEKTSF